MCYVLMYCGLVIMSVMGEPDHISALCCNTDCRGGLQTNHTVVLSIGMTQVFNHPAMCYCNTCTRSSILSPCFLYHPYIPHFLIRRIFSCNIIIIQFPHVCLYDKPQLVYPK